MRSRAGPYYVAEYRAGQRVVIRRNRFYRGTRPHHVDGFDVDLTAAAFPAVVDRIERGEADLGWVRRPTTPSAPARWSRSTA